MRGDWKYKVGDILARVGDPLHLYVVDECDYGVYYLGMKSVSTGMFCDFPWFGKNEVEDGQFVRVDDLENDDGDF